MAGMNDIDIAQSAKLLPVSEIAGNAGIPEASLEPYGRYKAKVDPAFLAGGAPPEGKLVLVTAITPTPAGEGKTTTTVGLADALRLLGKRSIVALREPSLGPVFGLKGGAAGGGYAQVVPMEDINLHFTGDIHAVGAANNLLAAMIDNHIYQGNALGLDPRRVTWRRCVDMNDRQLRNLVDGLGGRVNGTPREDGYDITVASEIMAVLCLADGIADLKERLSRIVVGYTFGEKPVTARDLHAVGAMAALLRDALKPNLVQTLGHTPAFVHGGPFANIAQGTNTIIATKMGLSLGDYVVTEAGFGADLGAEKFMNIKCGYAGFGPDAIVIVATIRALRHHGGAKKEEYNTASLERVQKGFENLQKHIENCGKYGLTPVVAINAFPADSSEEVQFVIDACARLGAKAVVSEGFAKGGEGTMNLAQAVVDMIESGANKFHRLYDWNLPVEDKIRTIAKEIYGADDVNFSSKALLQLKTIKNLGFDNLPVCMAKTQKSLSDNEKIVGRPTGFSVTVREFEFASGAGFVIPILGDMMRMPGLPEHPASEGMDIDDNGKITGLS